MPHKPLRIPQLDGVRAVAIAVVFIHHAFKIKILWMGVDLFFVLSGFLITGILMNTKEEAFKGYIGRFYERRARRILPAYLVVMGIMTVLVGTWWMKHWYMYIGLMNFLVPFGISIPDNLPLWSLAVEEQFYLLWPLAVYFLDRRQLVWCAAGMILLASVLRGVCTPLFSDHFTIYMLLPFRMDTLASGALLALVWPDIRAKAERSRKYRHILAALFVVLSCGALSGLVVLGKYGISTDANTWDGNILIYACTLAIAVSFMVMALLGFGQSLLSSWPLVWLGRLSYSIYLIHRTIISRVFSEKHILVSITIAVSMSLAYAMVMWFLIEKPFLTGRLPRFAREDCKS